ncbi:MAG: FAD:protein FMN transferase [Muribaculaceae bacterium]|nr:FAD:protein FMN transferase [Muribaculaceae bacterium]
MSNHKFSLPAISMLLLLTFFSCKKTEYVKMEGMVWNTLFHITYKGPASLRDSVLEVFDKVGKSLSVFDESSLVSALNKSDSVEPDRFLTEVYLSSKEINRISNGSFDPTVSPLIDAWGFGKGHRPNSDTIAVDSVLTFVGINKTRYENGFIIKDDIRTKFNFSAIAKGYGADMVGEMLERNGVEDYMVEIGGEIAVKGKSPGATGWKIAIDAPVEGNSPSENVALIVEISDCGLATSGNYRNYRKENGTTVAHTISPLTGKPFVSEILSASVIAPTCMEADALATACMASPLESAKTIISDYDGAQALFILSDTIWMSSGFEELVITSEVSEPGRTIRN